MKWDTVSFNTEDDELSKISDQSPHSLTNEESISHMPITDPISGFFTLESIVLKKWTVEQVLK